jgi:hypothetical protein
MSDDRPIVNVQAIAQALAFHLPDWRFTAVGETPRPGDPDYENWSTGNDYTKVRIREDRLTKARLVKGHLELVLTYSGYEKKLHIYGTFPTGYEARNIYPHDSVPVTSINVNPAKDPKRIAGDIRRIGAAYEEAYAKATTLKAKHDHQKQATRALVARIAKALGVPDPATTERHGNNSGSHRSSEDWEVRRWDGGGQPRVTVKVSSYDGSEGDRVPVREIQIGECDEATAFAILALISRRPVPRATRRAALRR